MRRIKSAPAEICNMVNRKKPKISMNVKKTLIIPLNSYEKIKEEKKHVKILTEIANDISGQNDIINQEIGYLILLFSSFINQNFKRKVTIENIKNFIIEMLLRYIVSITYHFIIFNHEKIYDIVINNHDNINNIIDKIYLLK